MRGAFPSRLLPRLCSLRMRSISSLWTEYLLSESNAGAPHGNKHPNSPSAGRFLTPCPPVLKCQRSLPRQTLPATSPNSTAAANVHARHVPHESHIVGELCAGNFRPYMNFTRPDTGRCQVYSVAACRTPWLASSMPASMKRIATFAMCSLTVLGHGCRGDLDFTDTRILP